MNVSVNCDVNGLAEALRQLGHDIAEASQPYLVHLYEVYVRQAYIVGWVSVVLPVMFLLCVLFAIGLVGQRIRKVNALNATLGTYNKHDLSCDALYIIGIVTVSVFGLGFLITLIVAATYGLPCILNPEYYALQDLLQHLPK